MTVHYWQRRMLPNECVQQITLFTLVVVDWLFVDVYFAFTKISDKWEENHEENLGREKKHLLTHFL